MINLLKTSIRRIILDLSGVFGDDSTYTPEEEEKHVKMGDIVEAHTGERGKVWKIYREIATNKVVYCSVIWETPYKGQQMSLFLPAKDVSPQFNPILRVVTSKNSG